MKTIHEKHFFFFHFFKVVVARPTYDTLYEKYDYVSQLSVYVWLEMEMDRVWFSIKARYDGRVAR